MTPPRRATPVYSLALEESCIGAMLQWGEVRTKALADLTTADFGDPATKVLFGLLAELGEDANPTLLLHKAQATNLEARMPVGSYIHTLISEASTRGAGLRTVAELVTLRRKRQAEDAADLIHKAAESEEPETVLSLARALIAPEAHPNGWKRWSASELLQAELPPPNWVLPGFLPEGLCVLAGRPKARKGFLALQASIAKTTGGRFLGQQVPERGRVLFFALEDNAVRLAGRLHDLECPPDAEELAFQCGMPPLLAGGVEYVQACVEELEPEIVWIDTISRALVGGRKVDQDKNADITEVLGPLQALALERHIAIVAIDHLRKSGPASERNVLTEIMGSTAKVGVADTIWGLYRKPGEAKGTLSIVGRDFEDQDLILEFQPTPVGWTFVGNAEEAGRTEADSRYLRAFDEVGEPADVKSLAGFLEVTQQSCSEQLRRMVDRGLLEVTVKRFPSGGKKNLYHRKALGRQGPRVMPALPADEGWDGPWWDR